MNYEQFYTAFLRQLINFGNAEGINHQQIAGECDINYPQYNVLLNHSDGMHIKIFFKIICGIGVNPADVLTLVQSAIDRRIEELRRRRK